MASLDRSPKPPKEWTDHDLDSYNIITTSLTPDEFFPAPDQPLDHIDPAILDLPVGIKRPPDIADDVDNFFNYLDIAANWEDYHGKSYIVDFVYKLLELLDYNELMSELPVHVIWFESLPFSVSSDASYTAMGDLCLFLWLARRDYVLVIFANGPEAQVVATAIAAFQYNNRRRRQFGFIPLDEMTFPCFNMIGRTRPTFYLVPVTTKLSRAVVLGQYPSAPTRVLRCETVPVNDQSARIGMEDPEYRRLALKRFIAFRELARCHRENISGGFIKHAKRRRGLVYSILSLTQWLVFAVLKLICMLIYE